MHLLIFSMPPSLKTVRSASSHLTKDAVVNTPATTLQRQDLLAAAGRIGEASHDLLANVQGQDSAIEEVLLAMAKGVANATAALVLKAKG